MKRLSGTDALFLSTETPAWHQHVGGLTVVDPAESERFSFAEVRRTLLERIPRVPKFRWKLKEVPLHLDRAVWIEDKDFDVDKHFRRIAVPPPGGRREVGDLLGMLMGYQLDRRRPLWEMWYVDGVDRRPGGADHQVPPLPDGRRVGRRAGRAALRPRAEPGAATETETEAIDKRRRDSMSRPTWSCSSGR